MNIIYSSFKYKYISKSFYSLRLITVGNVNIKMFKVEDNRLFTFTAVCDEVASERSYLNKAKILREFFAKGSDNKRFQGDLLLWVKMLIPNDSQRVYNLQNKQMLKLCSRIFGSDLQQMQQDLELGGDVSETLNKYFALSSNIKPQQNSTLYLQEVDEFLEELTQRTKEDEQMELLKRLCRKSTSKDLKTIIRIVKQDLRMNAKASHVLAAFGPMAYAAYQTTRDLATVLKQYALNISAKEDVPLKRSPKGKKNQSVEVQIMTPISPMLANACSSAEEAFKKCPKGLYGEIKYDGERVQIHKKGNEFRFFSRNLKPVMEYKVKRFKEVIPQAFPDSGDMILDSEIILVDTITGELLPFGSLGAHKKKQYQNAAVCLFVFDCLLFKGENLTNLSLAERRNILENNIKPLKSYVQLSESFFLKNKSELSLMMAKALKAHLEGVVLKDPDGIYQPGKRGWIKVKKDYLFEGKMADSADLVVLGASYGSGNKGGILSVFLMGCFDERDRLWKTVTKVHTGLDDSTRLEMHDYLSDLMERSNANKLPTWLMCNKPLVPDFVAKDPLEMPVWEITGAEFTKSGEHTANGISIRFPRITRLRDDKNAQQATDLSHLEQMYEASKSNVNVDLLLKDCDQQDLNIAIEINGKLNLPQISPCDEEKKAEMGKRKSEPLQDDNAKHKKVLKLNRDSKKESPLQKLWSSKEKSATKEPKLFENIVAHIHADLEGCSFIINNFKHNGGTVATNSKAADIIFYGASSARVTLEESRLKYKPNCRHLHINWLKDSLDTNKLQSYPLYAIVLK